MADAYALMARRVGRFSLRAYHPLSFCFHYALDEPWRRSWPLRTQYTVPLPCSGFPRCMTCMDDISARETGTPRVDRGLCNQWSCRQVRHFAHSSCSCSLTDVAPLTSFGDTMVSGSSSSPFCDRLLSRPHPADRHHLLPYIGPCTTSRPRERGWRSRCQ